MPHALLALGSNLGDRAQILDNACSALSERGDVWLLRKSHWHATQPIGGPTGQDVFLNGAALVQTSLSPTALHQRLKALEVQAGRKQTMQWAARPLDIDLLIYDDLVLQTRQLEVPHPRMAFRRFVLEPVAEIAPELMHPIIGWTMQRLLDHLNSAIPYLAITSTKTAANVDLAQTLVADLAAHFVPDPDSAEADPKSPSLLLAKELELIHKRGEALNVRSWPALSRWTVSPFWLGESLARGEALGLPPAEQQRLASAVGEAQAHSAPPKLLVLVDVSEERMGENASLAVQATRLRHWVQRPGVGPLLRIETTEQISAKDQVLAAVEAMA